MHDVLTVEQCLHADCPDYDLCQDCEAMPIPVHPLTHPLVKLKVPEAEIPAVAPRFWEAPVHEAPRPILVRPSSPYSYASRSRSRTPPIIICGSSTYGCRSRSRSRTPPIIIDTARSTSPSPPTFEGRAASLAPLNVPRIPSPISYPFPSHGDRDFDNLVRSTLELLNRNQSPDAVEQEEPYRLNDPPVIPTAWTPQENWTPPESWRLRMTPPCPMVVPRVLSEETTPLLQASVCEVTSAPSLPEPTFQTGSSSDPHATVVPSVGGPPRPPSPVTCCIPSPAPLPISPPSALIDLEEPLSEIASLLPTPAVQSSLGGLTTPADSEAPLTMPEPVPRLEHVPSQEWRDLWPEFTTIFRHLLQPPTPPANEATTETVQMPGGIAPEAPEAPEPAAQDEQSVKVTPTTAQEYNTPVEDSPLAGEALLARPAEMVERSRDFGHNLLEILSRVAPAPSAAAEPSPVVLPIRHQATFVSDNNIADGQIFPPGAEFVKSWWMRNDGATAWPEETTLRYVAGDRMAPFSGASMSAPVGTVPPSAEAELVGGEMKVCPTLCSSQRRLTHRCQAPDVPGKYVSYWRLHNGREFFGNSIWVEIVVAEPTHDDGSDESLAASSVIMPSAATTQTHTPPASTGVSGPPSTAVPSSPLSDDGSFDSSLSLIDAPVSSIEDEDEEIFQDSRERVVATPVDGPAQDMEYVVLYDTSSSEEE